MNIDKIIKSFESGDYSVIGLIIEEADNGNVHALSRAGIAYQLGLGVDLNVDKAIHYLSKASDLGSGEAAHNLATLYAVHSENKEKAQKFYSLARERGFQPGVDISNN